MTKENKAQKMVNSVLVSLWKNITSVAPSRQYPTEVNNGIGWIPYGLYILVVTICPLLLLMLVYCGATEHVICRTRCISGKRKGLFTGHSISFYRIAFTVFFAFLCLFMFVALCAYGLMGYSIVTMEMETFGTADEAMRRTKEASSISVDLEDLINVATDKVDPIYVTVKAFGSDVYSVSGALSGDLTLFHSLASDANSVFESLDVIKNLLVDIQELKERGIDVPKPSVVPDITDEKKYVADLVNGVDKMETKLDEIVSGVRDSIDVIDGRMNEVKAEMRAKAESIATEVNKPLSYIKNINQKYSKSSPTATKVVYSVTAGIFFLSGLFIVILFIQQLVGLMGIYRRKKGSIKCSLCGNFFLPFIIGIFATLHLILLILMRDLCREGEAAAKRSQPILSKYIGNDISDKLNISLIVDKVLNCNSEGQFLDAVPYLDMVDMINSTELIFRINKELNAGYSKLDVSQIFSLVNSEVDKMKEYSVSSAIDALLVQINPLIAQLDNVSTLVNDPGVFGYNRSYAEMEMDKLNTRSAELGGEYFTLDNITSLNPQSMPYSLDANFFEEQQDLLVHIKQVKDEANDSVVNYLGKVTRMQSTIASIEQTIESMGSFDEMVSVFSGRVREVYPLLLSSFNNIDQSVQGFLQFVAESVDGLENKASSLLGCEFVGDYHRANKQKVCLLLPISSGTIFAMYYLIAVFMLVAFVVLVPSLRSLEVTTIIVDDTEESLRELDAVCHHSVEHHENNEVPETKITPL